MASSRDNEMFVTAILRGNIAELAEWSPYADDNLSDRMKDLDYRYIGPEVARYFTATATRADWHRWGFRDDNARGGMLMKMMDDAVRNKRTDLFDIYLSSDINFNKGLSNFHMITTALRSELDDGQKSALVDALLRKGIDKVQSRDRFVETALRQGALRPLGLLVAATGVDIHKDKEAALRQAAVMGQKDLAKYMVEKLGADIDLAIGVAQADGFKGNAPLLQTVKDELQTVRDLQQQVAELKATVKELTEAVNELKGPEQKLDKPVLTRPHTP